MRTKKISAVIIAAILIASVFSGCGKSVSTRDKAIKEYSSIIKRLTSYSCVFAEKTVTVSHQADGGPATDTTVISSIRQKDGETLTAAHIMKSVSGNGDSSYLDFNYLNGKVYVDFSGQTKAFSTVDGKDAENCIKFIDPEISFPDPESFADVGLDESSAEISVRCYIPDSEYLKEASVKYSPLFRDYITGGTVSDMNGKIIYDKSSHNTVAVINMAVTDADGNFISLTYSERTEESDGSNENLPDEAGYSEIPGILSVFDCQRAVYGFKNVSGVSFKSNSTVKLSGKPEKTVKTDIVLDAETNSDGAVTFGFAEKSDAENYKDYKDYELNYEYNGQTLNIRMTDTNDQTTDITQNDAKAFIGAHLISAALPDPYAVTAVTSDAESGIKTVYSNAGNGVADIAGEALNKFGYFEDNAVITSYLPESFEKTVLDKNGNIISSEYHIVFTFSYYDSEEQTCTVDFKANINSFESSDVELF